LAQYHEGLPWGMQAPALSPETPLHAHDHAPRTSKCTPSTWYEVISTWYEVIGTWYEVIGTWYEVISMV
jgi:hypothetical protein